MITDSTINSIYQECLKEAERIYKTWQLRPSGLAYLPEKTTKYGEVDPCGVVYISPAFKGTNALAKLRKTFYHEFAHLIVGLHHGHNRVFKRVFEHLALGIDEDAQENQTIKENTKYKFRLLIHTADKVYDAGGFYRRSRKYLNYDISTSPMWIMGQCIEKCEYVPYGAPVPDGAINDTNL